MLAAEAATSITASKKHTTDFIMASPRASNANNKSNRQHLAVIASICRSTVAIFHCEQSEDASRTLWAHPTYDHVVGSRATMTARAATSTNRTRHGAALQNATSCMFARGLFSWRVGVGSGRLLCAYPPSSLQQRVSCASLPQHAMPPPHF